MVTKDAHKPVIEISPQELGLASGHRVPEIVWHLFQNSGKSPCELALRRTGIGP